MSEIDNKIRADLFRKRIEDKNTLTGAGAIYVGTGIPKYISSTGEIIGEPLTGTTGPFYETVGVTPTSGGQVPVSVMGTGSAEATGTVAGLEFKSVNDAMKDTDGNINLKTNGIFKVAGETDVNRPSLQLHTKQFDVEDLTNSRNIGIGNYIESGVSNSVTIGTSGSFGERCYTSVNSITLDSNFISGISIYTAPSGTPKMSTTGGISVYATGTTERNLAPIIYNIGQRLDSLGFKEEVVEDSSGNNLLTFRKIGYYVLVTLEQSISVVLGAEDFYCNVPQAFQKQKKETKTLFSIYLKASDRYLDLDTVVSISYRLDGSKHTIEFKNQDPCINARFNKGIIFGYDIRE